MHVRVYRINIKHAFWYVQCPEINQPVEMTRSARLLAIVHTVISRILAGHHSCVYVLCVSYVYVYIRMISLWFSLVM